MIQFTEWLAKGNQVRRFYRVMEKGSTEPTALFEIHCDLSKGFTGMIDTFVNFLVLPGPVKQETSLQASIALADDNSPIFFSAFVGPANDGSTIINVMGREDVGRCLKVFSAGTDIVFRLRSASDELIFQISLPNDHGFRKVYDTCREAMKDAPRERTPISDLLDEATRDLGVDDDQKAKGWTSPPRPSASREGSSQSKAGVDAVPDDRKYLELERTFAIVIIPPDDDPAHAVWLMNLDEKGEIDFDHEEFVLAQTATRDAALNYAMKLSNLLKLRVLELAKT